eukprot:9366527-Pyramimonas_sp.AAC.1
MGGAIPSADNLRKWGHSVSPECKFCGRTDATFHRCWECPLTAQVREEVCSPEMVQDALSAGPHSFLFSRCWLPKIEFTPGAKLYPDGNCLRPSLGELARAGWGVCELDDPGNLGRGICGPVPEFSGQTSGAGRATEFPHYLLPSVDEGRPQPSGHPVTQLARSSLVQEDCHGYP